MNPDDLFTEKTEVINLHVGQALFREGEPGDVMSIVVAGTAPTS